MTATAAETAPARAAQTVTVNGVPRPYRAGTLADLIAAEGLDPARRGLAAAVNARVIPRAEWAATAISPGDRVEIVRPLSGG